MNDVVTKIIINNIWHSSSESRSDYFRRQLNPVYTATIPKAALTATLVSILKTRSFSKRQTSSNFMACNLSFLIACREESFEIDKNKL